MILCSLKHAGQIMNRIGSRKRVGERGKVTRNQKTVAS